MLPVFLFLSLSPTPFTLSLSLSLLVSSFFFFPFLLNPSIGGGLFLTGRERKVCGGMCREISREDIQTDSPNDRRLMGRKKRGTNKDRGN